MTRYEILKSLPTYGPMYISVSNDERPFYSEGGFIVRFFKTDGTSWVANFKPGWTDFSTIYSFPNNNLLLVIAWGQCYIMNPDEIKPISSFGVDCKGLFELDDGTLILQRMTTFAILDINGEISESRRISWDGFKDIRVEGNLIIGLTYSPLEKDNWIPFTFNIKTNEITGGCRQFMEP